MKYTFIKDDIKFVEGEMIETEGEKVECTFTLKMNALKLFENEYGKPLLKALINILKNTNINSLNAVAEGDETPANALEISELLMDADFIKALASSTYVKIENNQGYNNETTQEEFKQSFMYDICVNDIKFITQLISMSTKAIFDEKKKDEGSKRGKK